MLGQLSQTGRLDIRGVVISEPLCMKILEAAPHHDDGHPMFTDALFDSATFEGIVRFGGATFKSYARFDGVTFEDTAGFSGAMFEDNAGFNRATFQGGARFAGATFRGTARFNRATFQGKAATFHLEDTMLRGRALTPP